DLGPVSSQRGNQLIAWGLGPVRSPPGRTGSCLGDLRTSVFQALEKGLPFRVHGTGIGEIAGIKILDIGGVAAVEERSQGEGGIGVLAGHSGQSLMTKPPPRRKVQEQLGR